MFACSNRGKRELGVARRRCGDYNSVDILGRNDCIERPYRDVSAGYLASTSGGTIIRVTNDSDRTTGFGGKYTDLIESPRAAANNGNPKQSGHGAVRRYSAARMPASNSCRE